MNICVVSISIISVFVFVFLPQVVLGRFGGGGTQRITMKLGEIQVLQMIVFESSSNTSLLSL